ncbi:RluA family pseudouridine synthase [Paenibacillus sp. 481]|nr:RluA family pseudouridine synthase [Paenibacillus sp. 481]UHA76131.1 RluA family pseudouridine synthase [Paenibacillus sp. 481]
MMQDQDKQGQGMQGRDVAELKYVVPEEEAGIQLKTILRTRLHLSRRLNKRLKELEDAITVNGERRYATERLLPQDVVVVRIKEMGADEDYILPEPMPIDVVYEDDDILVLNKPAGIVVHPTKGYPNGTLANGVVHYWRSRGELTKFRPANRLDQDTSGLMIVVKHAYAHQQLAEQMIDRTMDKVYTAFVYGVPFPRTGTVDAPIDRDPVERHLRIVTPSGYPSVTHYETVEEYEMNGQPAAMVRCKLETGRTHQIRVHMKHIGCPLIGDRFYKRDDEERPSSDELEMESDGEQREDCGIARQALHASELAFNHPISAERLQFHVDLPPDMEQLRQRLSQA